MKLELVNIGKISNANIELNGITVIAGENNTGKSTVGKALYSVFRGLLYIDERIMDEKLNALDNLLFRSLFFSQIEISMLNYEELKLDLLSCDKTKEAIIDVLNKYSISLVKDVIDADKLVQNIQERLEITDEEILNSLITKAFNSEFSDQICNVRGNNKGEVTLTIKEKPIKISFDNNKLEHTENLISFYSDIVYIDDPFVLDNVSPKRVLRKFDFSLGHMNNLIHQILEESKVDVVGEIITNKKLDVINERINSICSGELVKVNGSIEYKQGENNLSIRNLSTGLKTFVILKTLLKNGVIIENSTVILDEPEIHLHPEWQIILAEVIVLLQKEFDLNILLNTHSPYFLEAIEVYSEKHKITDKCKYYLSENTDNGSIINDVTDSTELIYKKLAKPFQTLENERYSDD